MTTKLTPEIELGRRVVGRSESLLAGDLQSHADVIGQRVGGSTMLLIGGAGSIGASTLRTLLEYEPAVVHVVDHNENGLAELVRSLRSARAISVRTELLAMPMAHGGPLFQRWLEADDIVYDHVFNFAALKHVRSEKDPYSILAMLETNVLHLDTLAAQFAERRPPTRVFSVSTDKAANPSSMMGATKRLMEHALFAPATSWGDETAVTSARFANVAFSNGSLLQAWLTRLAQRQPLACPADTRRYFVTLEESGHLCALAALTGTPHHICIPDLDPSTELVLLTDVVSEVLDHFGFRAEFTESESEAIDGVDEQAAHGRWPVLLTPLDTGGEKPYEEFVGAGETITDSIFEALREIKYRPPDVAQSHHRLIAEVTRLLQGRTDEHVTQQSLRALIADVEPAFAASHRASSKSLDERV